MLWKSLFWVKGIFNYLSQAFTLSRSNPTIFGSQNSTESINRKIKIQHKTTKNCIDLFAYHEYFDFLTKLGLREDFELKTTQDNLLLRGTSLRPLLLNNNNHKIVIFCHGVTNNRWAFFYCMHLTLQIGYQIITYDARNHGLSEKSYTTLGRIEASDLQDVINYVRKRYRPKKIGLYGFSMGAATCLFWISKFASQRNSEVALVICEAPYDDFSKQLEFAFGSGRNRYWKKILITKLINETLNTSYEELEKNNLLMALPAILPLKLLLIHGLQDTVIDWKSSFNIWNKLRKNKLNKKKINLYFCRFAEHGEISAIGDYVPHSLLRKDQKTVSKFTFSTLFFNYLQKNL